MDGYTLGIEEEYQILDPEDLGLVPSADRVLERARDTLGSEEAELELHASQIEIITPVCHTLGEVRAELSRLRRGIIEAARKEGCLVAAASTHPFSRWEDQPITPKERYRDLIEREQRLAEEQVVFGFHVHVGMQDRELGIKAMNRARAWLPPLLALSANSPFWLGADTGYASYRTQLWGRTPTAGPPEHFESLAEHDATVQALVNTGVTPDASQIYWDVRLPEKVDTIEVRVADVCSRTDETIMLAGLIRALISTCCEQSRRDEPYPAVGTSLLRAAIWSASRHGLDARLIDLEAEKPVPARDLVEKLLAHVRPALEEAGDWDEVSILLRETLDRGNGATRQREAYEQAGQFEDVVEMLVEETRQGI